MIRVIARESDPRSFRVGDVMTREPVLAAVDSSVSSALHYMREIGVRRMPVVDSAGRLVGLLSLDEVLDALAQDLRAVANSIRRELKVEHALRP